MLTTKVIIDWLQLSCFIVPENTHPTFELKKLPFQTKIFRQVEELYIQGIKVAIVASVPNSSALNANLAVIKILNEILYNVKLDYYLRCIFSSNYYVLNNITRLDIALDFNYFKGHYHPEKLIDDFVKMKILKIGALNYKLTGKQEDIQRFDYIRFGSAGSAVSAYLYNKSKELKEVCQKNYILKLHENSNLDTSKDIWRLEFSLKDLNSYFLVSNVGEIIDIEKLNILNYEKLEILFNSLLHSHFRFVKNIDKNRKERNTPLTLFNRPAATFKYMRLYCDSKTNKSDKMFIKKFEEFNCELRENESGYQTVASNLLYKYVKKKNLSDWYERRFNKRLT
jgi:hypothetical protein